MGDNVRLQELDGLRGIAVISVVIFHYFDRWTLEQGAPLYPYGTVAKWASYGAAGVDLFFVVSGFVIFMSLQTSASFGHFVAKRADRLIVPMIFMSSVTFLVLTWLPTPFLEVKISDFLPSWTFTHPSLFQWLDTEVGYIDGVYWTLFYEVRFYLLVSFIWFALSRESTVIAIVSIAVLMTVISIVIKVLGHEGILGRFELISMYSKLPLFGIGMVMSVVYNKGMDVLMAKYIVALMASMLLSNGIEYAPTLIVICFAVFVVAMRWGVAKIFAWPPLIYVGAASYSLYLVHHKIGVALIYRLPREWPLWAQLLAVVAITALLIAVARVSYRYMERNKPFTYLFRTLYSNNSRH